MCLYVGKPPLPRQMDKTTQEVRERSFLSRPHGHCFCPLGRILSIDDTPKYLHGLQTATSVWIHNVHSDKKERHHFCVNYPLVLLLDLFFSHGSRVQERKKAGVKMKTHARTHTHSSLGFHSNLRCEGGREGGGEDGGAGGACSAAPPPHI